MMNDRPEAVLQRPLSTPVSARVSGPSILLLTVQKNNQLPNFDVSLLCTQNQTQELRVQGFLSIHAQCSHYLSLMSLHLFSDCMSFDLELYKLQIVGGVKLFELHKGGGTNKTSDQRLVVLLNSDSGYQLLNPSSASG